MRMPDRPATPLPSASVAAPIEVDVYVPTEGKYVGFVLLHIEVKTGGAAGSHFEIPFLPENAVLLAGHLVSGAVQALRSQIPAKGGH